jgi:hypothetical protein
LFLIQDHGSEPSVVFNVHVDHLDLYVITQFDDIRHALGETSCNAVNWDKTVTSASNVDKGTEILDGNDCTIVDFACLQLVEAKAAVGAVMLAATCWAALLLRSLFACFCCWSFYWCICGSCWCDCGSGFCLWDFNGLSACVERAGWSAGWEAARLSAVERDY